MEPKKLDDKWIEEKLHFLYARIGLFRINKPFLFEPSPQFYKLCCRNKDKLQEAVNLLADHLELKIYPQVKLDRLLDQPHVKDTMYVNPDGQADSNQPENAKLSGYYDNYEIRVSPTIGKYSDIMGALLAHEITHYFMFRKGINLKDHMENERFTDVSAVFLGLGKLMLNRRDQMVKTEEDLSGTTTITTKFGYVYSDTLLRAYQKIIKFRNISYDEAATNLIRFKGRINSDVEIERFFADFKKRRQKVVAFFTYPFKRRKTLVRTSDTIQRQKQLKCPKHHTVLFRLIGKESKKDVWECSLCSYRIYLK